MAKAFIYSLKDPQTNEIRYIGKANNPKRRLGQHIRDCYRNKFPVAQWIQSLKDLGLRPIMENLEGPVDDWEEAEKKWIALFRKTSKNLLNVQDGGNDYPKAFLTSPTRKGGHWTNVQRTLILMRCGIKSVKKYGGSAAQVERMEKRLEDILLILRKRGKRCLKT